MEAWLGVDLWQFAEWIAEMVVLVEVVIAREFVLFDY